MKIIFTPHRTSLYVIVMYLMIHQSCAQTTEQKGFKIFNEGVTLSLNAGEAANKGDMDKAKRLNEEAIQKFKETISVDSTHKGARSALAHCLYLNKKSEEAITWFEKGNTIDPQAINYQEMGFCKINLGEVAEGKKDIYTALRLDTTAKFKENTVENIYDIGKLAFEYSEGYKSEGNKESAVTYHSFSIKVLKLALEIDPKRNDISNSISEITKQQ